MYNSFISPFNRFIYCYGKKVSTNTNVPLTSILMLIVMRCSTCPMKIYCMGIYIILYSN